MRNSAVLKPQASLAPAAALPRKFGRYCLLEKVAVSQMAEVYLAARSDEHPVTRLLAVKKLHSVETSDPEKRQRFAEEIRIVAGLNHPSIVKIFDHGEERGEPFIVMEWIQGRSLRQIITAYREAPVREMPLELAVGLMLELARAVEYLHSFSDPLTGRNEKILHRDLSPSNVMVSQEGFLKLIDFGISTSLSGPALENSGKVQGKASYLSPEQLQGLEADQRSDIFSIGIVFFELLTGEKLFVGERNSEVFAQIRNADQRVGLSYDRIKSKSPEVARLLVQCLRADPKKRYQFAHRLITDLEVVAGALDPVFNPALVREYMSGLFLKELEDERQHQLRLVLPLKQASQDDFTMVLDLPVSASPPALVSGEREARLSLEEPKIELEEQRAPTPRIYSKPQGVPVEKKSRKKVKKRSRRSGSVFLALAVLGAALWVGGQQVLRAPDLLPGFAWINLTIRPAEGMAMILVEGQTQFLKDDQLLVPTQRPIRLKILKAGYAPVEREIQIGNTGPYRERGETLAIDLQRLGSAP